MLFGLSPALTKVLVNNGMSASSVVFWMHSCSMVINFFAALIKGSGFTENGVKSAAMLWLTGAFGMGVTAFLLNVSYNYLDVGMATLLHFIYPTLVTICMALFFRQRLTLGKISAITVSLLGLIMLTGNSASQSIAGIISAVGSGVFYAVYIIINEKSKFAHCSVNIKMTFMAAGSATVFGAHALLSSTFRLPNGLAEYLVVLAIGVFSAIGYCLLTYGIQHIGASKAALGTMLEPVTSVIFGAIMYGEIITLRTVCGSVFILISVLFIRGKAKEKKV